MPTTRTLIRSALIGGGLGFGAMLIGGIAANSAIKQGTGEGFGAWIATLTFPYSWLFNWIALRLPRGPSFYVGVVAVVWLGPVLQGATIAVVSVLVRDALRSRRDAA